VRTASVAIITVLLAALPTKGAIAGGTVLRLTMSAPSLHEAGRTVRVYLPPSYDRPESAHRRYPVVYLLHGWPGSDGNWFSLGKAAATADSLIARGQIPEVLLVCPNGNGRGLLGLSLYINSWDGRSRMEDFIVQDVVQWTDSTFRTVRSPVARAIIGLSEGGNAALNLAFRHPDVFGACAGHSGEYRISKGFGSGRVLGPEPGASRLLAENSPALYADRIAPQLRRQVIYFDIGVSDEDLEDNRAFDRRLDELGVPHTYHEFPGSHTWRYWTTHLRDSLVVVTARMRGL
jgi:S-formylglutathione hydrolase FrmB